MVGGECKAIPVAQYQIIGKTPFDQDYIDQVIESGVAACGWPRPAERPKNWDEVRTYARTVAAAPPVVQRPGIYQRVKAKFRRKPKPVAEVTPAPTPVPRAAVVTQQAPVQYIAPPPPPAPPPQPKREAIDELLNPTPVRVIPLR